MDWRKLREARMSGMGVRAHKPRPAPQSLEKRLAEEYARKICGEIMKPHNDIIEVLLRAPVHPRKRIELTPELRALAIDLLRAVKYRGELIRDSGSPMGGSTAMRFISDELAIYAFSGSHWGTGNAELTVFEEKNCVFACIFRWNDEGHSIEILRHPRNLSSIRQLALFP